MTKNIDWNSLSEEELYSRAAELKKEKNCFILAHNYQFVEVQKMADYVGDSLQMAKIAAKTDADMILLCGIIIMGETAKILNPDKKVIMAHKDADCRLALLKSTSDLIRLKEKHPGAEVVCYVNSQAELKAESTITCTSANAIEVVDSIPKDKEVIFVPDKNIGAWVSYNLGRELILFDSTCYVHDDITLEDVKEVRSKYPNYSLLAHPECRLNVCKAADLVCSTSQMLDFAKEHDNLIIGTEYGLYEQLRYLYPQKHIVSLSKKMICEDMKKTTLRGAVRALAEEKYEIKIPQEIVEKTKKSLNRMMEIV
ncbi:MAG: quinolinate synthase NadA [Candidatus Cloacimonadota bacterium]|nr:quinolinate synthase NadA [Candidatus Cloacimonadota bacterium]